jgi:PleD family two-component response regulator
MRTECRSPNSGFRSLREDAPEQGTLMKYKILVGDDEAAILNLIKDTLDSLGAEVVSATDSQGALRPSGAGEV